ncbi:MAG: hypothetical protein KDA59_24670, partial [Planctomycetales bacterium]|nr:hypothetical protein [Planctomycetales bacterium]
MFRQGLQWWLRGRYGRGPDGYGLLKSELALISPAAQMGIYLPNETPTPTDPANPSKTAVPEVDRRHHYIWGMEYRRVQQVSSESMTATGKSTNRWTPVPLDSRGRGTGGNPSGRSQRDGAAYTVSVWNVVQSSITAEDSRYIRRLVGFQEYSNALQKLDRLSSLSTPEEFAVYDELVGRRDEFRIYTNLSRRWERQPSSLSSTIAGEKYERRGMRWVTALARTEVGSMLTAFSSVPNPYDVIAVGTNDQQEYHDLLLDGTRAHYWALKQDPAWSDFDRFSRDVQRPLTYTRRLQLAKGILEATGKRGTYFPIQQQELLSWRKEIMAWEAVCVMSVRSALETQKYKTREIVGSILLTGAEDVALGRTFKDLEYHTP